MVILASVNSGKPGVSYLQMGEFWSFMLFYVFNNSIALSTA